MKKWQVFSSILLGDLRLFRDDDRHNQVHDGDPAKTREEREDNQQTYDGRVDAEVLAQARANAREHAVGRAACELPVVVHDVILLSMISTRTYAGEREKLQKFGVGQLAVQTAGARSCSSNLSFPTTLCKE